MTKTIGMDNGLLRRRAIKLAAMAYCCEHADALFPCGECESCKRVESGMELDVLEVDVAMLHEDPSYLDRIVNDMPHFKPASHEYQVMCLYSANLLGDPKYAETSSRLLAAIAKAPATFRVVMVTAP